MAMPSENPSATVLQDSSWPCCINDYTLHDPDIPSETPAYAVLSGDLTQTQRLAAAGSFARPADAWTIYEACLQGPRMIQALSVNLSIDLNPIILGQMGDHVFHFLLRTSRQRFLDSKFATIKQLLHHNINPLEPDRFGNTALHILAGAPMHDESFHLMELLLGNAIPETVRASCVAGIDFRNGQNEDGETALHIAVLNNNASCTRLLLDHGASPHAKDTCNRTPFYLAVLENHFDTARLLLEYGAIVEPDVLAQLPEMSAAFSRYM